MLQFFFINSEFTQYLVKDFSDQNGVDSTIYDNNWDWNHLKEYAGSEISIETSYDQTTLSVYVKWLIFEIDWSEEVEHYIVQHNLFHKLTMNFRLPPPSFLKKYEDKIQWLQGDYNFSHSMGLQLFYRGNLGIEHFKLLETKLNQCTDYYQHRSDNCYHLDVFYRSLIDGWGSYDWSFDLLDYLLRIEINHHDCRSIDYDETFKSNLTYENLHLRHKKNIWNKLFRNNVDENFLNILKIN